MTELFSPPRATTLPGAIPDFSAFAPGSTFDLRYDRDGLAGDFLRADHRRAARLRICEQYTHKCSTCRAAHSIITLHHAWLKDCASLCPSNHCHPRVMSHLPLFASSPIFPLTSQTPTKLLEHDEHSGPDERSHCDDLRQSGGFTQTVTPTGYEPKVTETTVIDSEAISAEDLEPRRIELDRNLGTDPYQIHE